MKPIRELKEVTLNSGFIHILTMVSGDLNHSSDRACSGEFRTQKKGIGRFNESGFRQRSDNVTCPNRSDSGKRRELGKASEKKKQKKKTRGDCPSPSFPRVFSARRSPRRCPILHTFSTSERLEQATDSGARTSNCVFWSDRYGA